MMGWKGGKDRIIGFDVTIQIEIVVVVVVDSVPSPH